MELRSRILIVAAFVAVALAAASGASAAKPPADTRQAALSDSEPTPARPELRTCDLGMPRKFRCGHIMVPALRGDPALGKTKVAFAIRHRRDTSRPSLGTIVAMDGGPGYAATAKPYAASLIAALGPVLRRRDLVLYDMRGTGRSDAIDCRALQAGLIQESIAIGECANQLGPRYAGYTSAEGAEDLDLLRRALGLGKIFFYGDSYGDVLRSGLRRSPSRQPARADPRLRLSRRRPVLPDAAACRAERAADRLPGRADLRR